MDRRQVAIAGVVGVVPLLVLLWAFFPALLPVPTSDVAQPWRVLALFLAVVATGVTVGRCIAGGGFVAGAVAGLPGAVVGGLLGLAAALRPRDLAIVAVLVPTLVLVPGIAAWLADARRR